MKDVHFELHQDGTTVTAVLTVPCTHLASPLASVFARTPEGKIPIDMQTNNPEIVIYPGRMDAYVLQIGPTPRIRGRNIWRTEARVLKAPEIDTLANEATKYEGKRVLQALGLLPGWPRTSRVKVADALAALRLDEAVEQGGHVVGLGRNVSTYLHMTRPELSRRHPDRGPAHGILNEQQTVRKTRAELAMDPADALDRQGRERHRATVDHPLNVDVGLRLKLKIALFGLVGVVVLQRAFDVDEMGVVSLDEIRVVAVHRPNDVSDGRFKGRVQASGEGAGFLHQYEYLITKTRIEVRKHRFHWAYAGHFAAISAYQI